LSSTFTPWYSSVTGFFGVCGIGSAPNSFSMAIVQTTPALTSKKRILIKIKNAFSALRSMTISQLLLALAFGGFGNCFFRRLKPDLRMRAVTKRLFCGCTATTKRHPPFHWKRVSIRVDELNRSLYNVRAVFNRLDSYVSHDGGNLIDYCALRPL